MKLNIVLLRATLGLLLLSPFVATPDFAHAQAGVVIGDTEVVGSLTINGSDCCTLNLTGIWNTNSEFSVPYGQPSIASSVSYPVWFSPTRVGVAFDTEQYSYYYSGYCIHCGPGGIASNVTRAVGLSDSLVRIRPKQWMMDLWPDSIRGGWVGTADPLFDNNVADTTIFSRWKITSGDTTALAIEVEANDTPITAYTSLPLRRKTYLHYIVTSKRGPIYSNSTHVGAITTTVTNHSGIFRDTARLIFVMHEAPFKFDSYLEDSLVEFMTAVGAVDSQNINLHLHPPTPNVSFSTLSSPFSFRQLAVTDTSQGVRIYCSPTSGGIYAATLKAYVAVRDFNGDIRTDSLLIPIRAKVSTSHDSVFWESSGLSRASVRSLVNNSREVVANADYLYESTDHGDSWSADSGIIAPTIVGVDNAGYLYAEANFDLQAKYPGGSTWSSVSFPSIDDIRLDNINCMAISPSGLVAASGSGYYTAVDVQRYAQGTVVSRDHGISWGAAQSYSYTSILVFDSTNSLLLVDSSGLGSVGLSGWNPPSQITTLGVDNEGNYYAGVQNGGIYTSSDLGSSWEATGAPEISMNAIATTPDGEIYASSYGNGIYESLDHGATWFGVNKGLPTLNINCLAAQPGGRVFVGTDGYGVYRSIAHVGMKVVAPEISSTVRLSQNYPNPFSVETTIRYELPRTLHTKLDIYDELGRLVKTLLNSTQRAGKYSAKLDASGLQAGIYICRLSAGPYIRSCEMAIVR